MPGMRTVRFLTIHCAATPEGRAVTAEQIANWGRDKFGQPSYHWVVDLEGKAHRLLPDTTRGAHVGGANTGNIGICYVGGMAKNMEKAKDTRTEAQKTALLTLVRTYKSRYPGIIIRGHRDWPGVKKDCPSFDVKGWLESTGDL